MYIFFKYKKTNNIILITNYKIKNGINERNYIKLVKIVQRLY